MYVGRYTECSALTPSLFSPLEGNCTLKSYKGWLTTADYSCSHDHT